MPNCPVPNPRTKRNCGKEIPPNRVMCADDWKRVPYKMQKEVWAHYRPGQNAMTVSRQYLEAREAAIAEAAAVRIKEENRG